ncbi:MAG: polysaccharide deacetylase family protein [Solirubrobacterales bacterium]
MPKLQSPEISVVIASFERRQMLERCLRALAEQDQDPGSYEVLVALDGSKDDSGEMAEALELPFALRVLRLPRGGKAAAANTAMREARGAVLLFLDDDVIASPGLLSAHLSAHRRQPRAVGIGALTQAIPTGRDWYTHAYAEDWNERYGKMAAAAADWTDCYGGNLSVPRDTALEVGGFATELIAVEDIEFGWRLSAAGCEPVFLPDALALHADEKPRKALIDDVWRFGQFCADFCEQHPRARGKLLGWFYDTTPRELLIRRLLLALHAKPPWLAALGMIVPGQHRRRIWFGFVSRFTFWSGAKNRMRRRRWRETTGGVPVLMYHAFTDNGEHDRYIVSRRRFRAQMLALRLLRYKPIRFGELAEALRGGEALPWRAVVITVDDGYADNLDVAMPTLRRLGVPATFFLVSDKLGTENDWDDDGGVAHRPLMGRTEVERMRAAGAELGAHTRTHVDLPTLGSARREEEIGGSRQELEVTLGQPVLTFAYPYGRFDEATVESVDRAEFLGACTVEGSPAHLGDDPLRIPRIEIKGDDSLPRFLRKLWFGGN